jgi:hypothetical protein
MLITDETQAVNPRTGKLVTVLTESFGDEYEQRSPDWEELRAWAQDPAILSTISQGAITAETMKDLGIGFDINRLPVLIGLRLRDWASAQGSRLMPMVTRIGLVRQEDIGALTSTAHAVVTTLIDVIQTEPGALTEDIAKKAVFDFLAMASNLVGMVNPYAALALSVVNGAAQFVDAIVSMKNGDATEAAARLPLITPANESSDRGRVESIRKVMGGWATSRAPTTDHRDWTELCLPQTRGTWNLYEVGGPRPADLGFAVARSETGRGWTAGHGFGFMPGTSRTQGLLQFTSPWRSVRDHRDTGLDKDGRRLPPTANWGSHYCDPDTQKIGASGAACFQSAESFDGGSSCRQCIPIHSWTGGRSDWAEVTNAYDSQVVNVDDWLLSSTESLEALCQTWSVSNPSTWCWDVETIYTSWHTHWSDYFDFIEWAWGQHDAYPWRALLSHFGAMGLISREDGRIGGIGTMLDWRVRRWGEYDAGIQSGDRPGVPPIYSGLPTDPVLREKLKGAGLGGPQLPDRTALRYIQPTPFVWHNSIFERAIRPACEQLAQTQVRGYETTMLAYLWMDQGAHYDAAAKRQRKNRFGDAYEANLRELLSTPRLRSAVAMRHVVDPKVRQLLIDAGVQEHQAGGGILAPDLNQKTVPPARKGTPVLVSFADDWKRPPGVAAPLGGYPGRRGAWQRIGDRRRANAEAQLMAAAQTEEGNGIGWGTALLIGGALTGSVALAMRLARARRNKR